MAAIAEERIAQADRNAVEVLMWRTFARRWLPILAQSTICLRSQQRVSLTREVRMLMDLVTRGTDAG